MNKESIIISILREKCGVPVKNRFNSFEKLIEKQDYINDTEGWIPDWLRIEIPRAYRVGTRESGCVILKRRDFVNYQIGVNNDNNRQSSIVGFWIDPKIITNINY